MEETKQSEIIRDIINRCNAAPVAVKKSRKSSEEGKTLRTKCQMFDVLEDSDSYFKLVKKKTNQILVVDFEENELYFEDDGKKTVIGSCGSLNTGFDDRLISEGFNTGSERFGYFRKGDIYFIQGIMEENELPYLLLKEGLMSVRMLRYMNKKIYYSQTIFERITEKKKNMECIELLKYIKNRQNYLPESKKYNEDFFITLLEFLLEDKKTAKTFYEFYHDSSIKTIQIDKDLVFRRMEYTIPKCAEQFENMNELFTYLFFELYSQGITCIGSSIIHLYMDYLANNCLININLKRNSTKAVKMTSEKSLSKEILYTKYLLSDAETAEFYINYFRKIESDFMNLESKMEEVLPGKDILIETETYRISKVCTMYDYYTLIKDFHKDLTFLVDLQDFDLIISIREKDSERAILCYRNKKDRTFTFYVNDDSEVRSEEEKMLHAVI